MGYVDMELEKLMGMLSTIHKEVGGSSPEEEKKKKEAEAPKGTGDKFLDLKTAMVQKLNKVLFSV